ncbi:hypothetical protein [Yoonia sp. BS5-3]|uniref:Uncharacterized protein n=1 Tax=Yoonia phaeophyticola TaxID=3137369 RepID=A0ABZ2V8Y3_9RHOB
MFSAILLGNNAILFERVDFLEGLMAQAHVPFDKRLKRIVRNHDRMANGVVKTVNSDGLIVVKPRVFKPRFPLKGLLAIVVLGFLFKGVIYATLGSEQYAERVAVLQQGSMLEQAGAWIMQPDPATLLVAEGVGTVLSQ